MEGFAELMKDLAEGHARIARAGMVAGEENAKRYIRAITAAYCKAVSDPQFRCPSYLMAAIESAKQYELASDNLYANAMVKRDREMPKWERDSRTGAKEEA